MTHESEDFESQMDKLAEEWELEVRAEIDEAAVLTLCFPGSETGNDAAVRLNRHAKEHPQIYWHWVSEKFPEQKHYWKAGLEKATDSTQPESDDVE